MGAPKQKWTPQEEQALKSGVRKHGPGKWRTILSDPEFSSILKSRSNVDLKDKWRNISVYGSRKKAKLALKRTPNQDDDNTTALTIVALVNGLDGGQQIDPALPRDFKGLSFTSVDKIILEAITSLKRPLGPDGKSILLYVEIKHRYRIAPNYVAAGAKQSSPQLFLEGNKENGFQNLSKSQVDGELFMIKGMTAQEAAEAAARAVAEAEFAIAEAEEAAREADEAEAEAEAAYIFAKAAIKAFKYRMHSQTW